MKPPDEANPPPQLIPAAGTDAAHGSETIVLAALEPEPGTRFEPLNVALGLAAIIFGLGAWFAFSPSKTLASQDAKLRARREKLMNEVVALERKRRQKPLSASEGSKLQRATNELERVVAELDRSGEAA